MGEKKFLPKEKKNTQKTNHWLGLPSLDNEQNIVNRQPICTLWSGFVEEVQWVMARRILISPIKLQRIREHTNELCKEAAFTLNALVSFSLNTGKAGLKSLH